jgi:porphobilinogen synthase
MMLFGVPSEENKNATGNQAIADDGILNQALRRVRAEVGDATVIMADTCLDEFTTHGHCGVLDKDGRVDNDATLERYAEQAVAQASAGAHMVSPSGMMDGQVGVIREALDSAGFFDVGILAYSAKYASGFYGPFREAVSCSLEGDRRTYQMNPANRREGSYETALDIAEGADMVMVKPAGYYLDIISDVATLSDVPVAAYQVSGEYAMIQAAAQRGWIDQARVLHETVVSILRAGADVVLTYGAMELASALLKRKEMTDEYVLFSS